MVAKEGSFWNYNFWICGEYRIQEKYSSLPNNCQWCNLILARQFWAAKVCLRGSKIFKICLFGCPTGRATSWKASFENCYRYSLIKWYQFTVWAILLFVWYTFLLSACSSQSHATSCLSLMSHHRVNNKCNRVKRTALKMANLCPS